MKALPTQFDDKRLSNAVATPTCSSCCCCCCCLATSIASSTLLAQRIGKEGEKHKVHNRHVLTVIATLFIPIVGMLVYLGYWTINSLLTTCKQVTYSDQLESYSRCTEPGSIAIWPLLIIIPMLVLWFLYASVQVQNPARRAMLVTTFIAIAFTAELFAGAALILTGVGGIVYLIMVPIIIGWITVWYHRRLGAEAANLAATEGPSLSGFEVPFSESNEPQTEQNDQEPAEAEKPPQQNPPTTSA